MSAHIADARRMARMLLVVAVVALVAMRVSPFADASRAATSTRGQALFGMNVPSLDELDDSESALGVHAAIVGTFADWAHTPDFPTTLARDVNRRGAVLLVSWEPWDSWQGGTEQPRYALRRIVAGDHDALLDRWAQQVAAFGRPVMLRFAAEMNGDWLPWSTGVNSNRRGDYVAAWRHVRERFRRAGASNATWVWNPIATYDGSTPLRELFPGAREVDWMGVDGYNWGDARAWGWQSYADVLAPTVHALGTLAPKRPVMIAETASAPGPRKAAWVTNTLGAARADGVDALVWFEFEKETDWRLAADPAVAKPVRDALRRGWREGGDLAAVERLTRR